jgi:hypothetical protein
MRGDPPAVLDLVKETLHAIARSIQMRAKADGIFAISLRGDVGPCALLLDERSDPVRVIAAVCEHH